MNVKEFVKITAPVTALSAHDVLSIFAVWLEPNGSEKSLRTFTNLIHPDSGTSNPDFVQHNPILKEQFSSMPEKLWFLELGWGVEDAAQNVASESRGLVLLLVDGKEGLFRRTGFFSVALEQAPSMTGSGITGMLSVKGLKLSSHRLGNCGRNALRCRLLQLSENALSGLVADVNACWK